MNSYLIYSLFVSTNTKNTVKQEYDDHHFDWIDWLKHGTLKFASKR